MLRNAVAVFGNSKWTFVPPLESPSTSSAFKSECHGGA
eukprot:COSAG01_NODE_57308_length_313_cov_0.644860_1_plen_37_part_01